MRVCCSYEHDALLDAHSCAAGREYAEASALRRLRAARAAVALWGCALGTCEAGEACDALNTVAMAERDLRAVRGEL